LVSNYSCRIKSSLEPESAWDHVECFHNSLIKPKSKLFLYSRVDSIFFRKPGIPHPGR
jgi:hypothetical protein